MSRESHEPSQPVVAPSRLTEAVGRIQGASSDEEALQLVGEAARGLFSAERVVAPLGDAAAVTPPAIAFPLLASTGEVQAALSQEHPHGGVGLSLPLVRDLVSLHGGRVTARSEGLGRGSCFAIHLPPGTKKTAPRTTTIERPCAASSRRILVVDDNEDAAEMLAMILRDLGHVVRIANDGPRALVVAAELDPEIALLDLGLPVMDGYELASRLLEVYGARGIRLIALTGYGQPEDRERTRSAGFDTHLVKPLDLEELHAALSASS